jgi:hypothetical protein
MQRDDTRDDTRDGVRKDGAQDGGSASTGNDYGFSGRGGFAEGSYSSAYGRGSAGARDNPSAGGVEGAGTSRGGNARPSPDPADVTGAGRTADDADETVGDERGRTER